MRSRLFTPSIALLVAHVACQGGCLDSSPLGRARRAFGSHMSVSEANVQVPDAHVFTAVPDPVPADYDGIDVVLVPATGAPLGGSDAVRFAWEHGVRDAEPLATLCALFLVGTENVAHDAQRDAGYIQNHESVRPPALEGGRLVFWAVRGSMAPEARPVTVDLSTFRVVATP